MLISRTGSYALQACRYLATHADDGFIPVSNISNELHLSSGQYLTKVMQRLKAKKIVQTSKGPYGGVRLGKPADIILLIDIIEATDSQAFQALLQNKLELLFPESPYLNQNYRFLEAKFYSGLKQTTLDHFSKQKPITNIPPIVMHSTKLKNTPVGEIVAENYHTADVFRQYGIDFCCGGHKTLEEVTSKNGLAADEIAEQLEQILATSKIDSEDYSNWSTEFLIDYIENTHHQYVRTKIPQILAYASKVAQVHGGRHPENIEIFNLFNQLSQELMDHLSDEEENVFPLIKKYIAAKNGADANLVDSSEFESALQKLVDDHEEAGNLVAQIRKLSNDFTPPEDACTTYNILYQNLEGFEQDLHKHVHLENNILFKKAEALV